MPIRDHCKYLGYMVGPGRKDRSWLAPYKKFQERIKLWKDMPLGLYWDARIYNMFMIPTLGYVAQLEQPPEWVTEGIASSLHLSAKGPYNWCSKEDLWQLQETLGLKCSFKKVDMYAKAAQSRVLHCEMSCDH